MCTAANTTQGNNSLLECHLRFSAPDGHLITMHCTKHDISDKVVSLGLLSFADVVIVCFSAVDPSSFHKIEEKVWLSFWYLLSFFHSGNQFLLVLLIFRLFYWDAKQM